MRIFNSSSITDAEQRGKKISRNLALAQVAILEVAKKSDAEIVDILCADYIKECKTNKVSFLNSSFSFTLRCGVPPSLNPHFALQNCGFNASIEEKITA
jgi:hypothetical protein